MRKLINLLLCLAAAALAGAWRIEVVDETETGGTSIALDSSDTPHIAYQGDGDLRYASLESDQWHDELVDEEDNWPGVAPSLVFNSLDRPCISYSYCYYEDGAKYAEWDGEKWIIRRLLSDCWGTPLTSLALDHLDRPHIAAGLDYFLCYAYWDGAHWQYEWDYDAQSGEVSLALDSSDRPHITYYWSELHHECLRYRYWDGSNWQDNMLHGGGAYNSLALDSTGNAHVAYYYNEHLYYDGELVDSQGDVGIWTDLALDSLDRPHIGYFDLDNNAVKYAHWDGGGWHVETVAPTGYRHGYSAIAIDSNDIPHLSYCGANEYLMHALYDPEGGVDVVDFGAGATDDGVLVDWRFEGGEPAGVRVLRGVAEPEVVSGLMPGASARYLDRGVEPGGSYVYWLEVVDGEGIVTRFGPTQAVSIPEETFTLVLYSAYPSPSADTVNFAYSIPADGRVVLSVYDLSGRRIATPVDTELTAGRHEATWNCGDIPSGVYLYRLETNAGSLTQRLVVSR